MSLFDSELTAYDDDSSCSNGDNNVLTLLLNICPVIYLGVLYFCKLLC